MERVESFDFDHTTRRAPFIREAARWPGIRKFDVRFLTPNEAAMPTDALHSLEHMLAVEIRAVVPGVIDLSPMGCRTGFYLTLFGAVTVEHTTEYVLQALSRVAQRDSVPAANEKACGNYKDHNLSGAQQFARTFIAEMTGGE